MPDNVDKEVVFPLNEGRDKSGQIVFLCPRCSKIHKFNIKKIKYCSNCGQHVAPAMVQATKGQEEFLRTIKEKDLK